MASPAQSDAADWPDQVESVLGRKLTSIEAVGGIYCSICHTTFSNKREYDSHYVEHSIGDADIGYTCVVCRREFTGYPSLRNHCYNAHVTKNKHKCEHCCKTYSKQSVLKSHIDSVHNFKCVPCKKQFSSKKELHTHEIVHKNEKEKPPYQCHVCGDTIDSIDMCEYHMDEHCTSLYPCPICEETSNSKIDAAKHLAEHFDEQHSEEDITTSSIGEDCSVDILGGVLCNYCDELFKNRIEIDTHFATEHSDKELVYSCNICGKQYSKYNLFSNHCYYHIAKNRFECTECGKTFPRLPLLVLHTEAFHSDGSAPKPFSCGSCGYGFLSARRLCEHTRIAHASSAMRCLQEGCDRTFESLRALVWHAASHRAQQAAGCRRCGLRLRARTAAERHLDAHRQKRYSCPVCTRLYHEKYLVLKHIPSHFEATLHVCKVCGKVFNLRSRLVQHSKTHSDLRSHICSFCNKGFMKAAHLEQHLNIHTGSKPYKCTACPKTFASYPNWYKHMRRMHNIEKQDIKTAKENQTNKTIAVTETPAVKNDNSDNKMISESGIDSTSSEISLETYSFAESDDSTMDSIDPTIIVRDWCITNDTSLDNLQYTDMLPVSTTTFDYEVSQVESTTESGGGGGGGAVLREYGPEFNVGGAQAWGGACIELDDHYLPHIDPLLTIKPAPAPPPPAPAPAPAPPAAPPAHWEPLITKVYHAFDDVDVSRLSYMNMNMDIY